MIHIGKLIRESLQLSCKLRSVNLRRRNIALEPRENFAVEAATVLLGAFLEPGRPLAESNAILWYFGDGTPYVPEDPYERAQTLQWLFFEQY